MIRTNKEAPMPRDKIKPPAESKAELMSQVVNRLEVNYGPQRHAAYEFLLNFFTAADLVGIREELKK